MKTSARIVLAAAVAVAVAGGWMAADKYREAEWTVSPAQIEAAKARGLRGYETTPGSVAVLPIRSEMADMLPFKWAVAGLFAGLVSFVASGRRKVA